MLGAMLDLPYIPIHEDGTSSPAVQQDQDRAYSALEAATRAYGYDCGGVNTRGQPPARERAENAATLRGWARREGRILNRESFQAWYERLPALQPGSEHEVRFDQSSGLVIKRTLTSAFEEDYGVPFDYGHAGLASEYLRQLHLSAFVLGDTIRLRGIVENSRGDFSIVTSQKFARPACDLNGEVIDLSYQMVCDTLTNLGFEEFGNGHFVDRQKNIRLVDAAEYNFVLTENGLAPIDVHVTPFREGKPPEPLFSESAQSPQIESR